jgi:hypothetical protein
MNIRPWSLTRKISASSLSWSQKPTARCKWGSNVSINILLRSTRNGFTKRWFMTLDQISLLRRFRWRQILLRKLSFLPGSEIWHRQHKKLSLLQDGPFILSGHTKSRTCTSPPIPNLMIPITGFETWLKTTVSCLSERKKNIIGCLCWKVTFYISSLLESKNSTSIFPRSYPWELGTTSIIAE